MHHVPATGGPLALAHLRAQAMLGLRYALQSVSVPWSPAEKRLVSCPNRGLAQFCVAVHATGRVEPAWGFLRRRSCGCSLPAQLSELPPRGQRGPAAPRGASGELELARAGSR